ncbi:MAG: hypothetical protein OEM25_08040, partial [Gammaproteobacteria bacterium]|nr:hypothetical protein [Gammaproteobacteria bacterium]
MPRILKWTVGIFAVLLLLAVSLGIAFKVVFDTEAGTRWALARANTALPGTIDAPDFNGTLWRGLRFSRLRYSDADRELEADNLFLKVDWGPLAAGRLTLETVAADAVRYVDLVAPPPEPLPFELSMAALPIYVSVDAVDVPRLEYLKQNRSLEILDIVIGGARLEDQMLQVRALSATVAGTVASLARVRTTLAGDVPIRADIGWRRLDDSWSGSGSVDDSLASLSFEHTLAGPYPATLSGTLQILHKVEPEVDANIRWDLWTFGETELHSGALHVRGVAGDYLADYAATVTLAGGRQLQVSGTARGTTEQLPSFVARIDNADASADVTGSLSWTPQFAVAAQVHASNVNPAAFVAELSGNLAADARVTVDDEYVVSIADLSVTGLLNDQPARATGNVEWAAQKQQCRACEIRVGGNVLRIDGESGGEEIAVSLMIDAPRLAELWPGLSGTATVDGRLAGSGSNPQFSGDLFAQQLGFEEWFIDELKIHSSESDLDALHISAAIASLRRGNAELGSLEITGEGRWQQVLVGLDWVVGGFVIHADGEIVRNDSVVSGSITNAQIAAANAGNWHLDRPLVFEVAGNNVSVAAHSWSGDNGSLQVRRFATTADEVSLVATIIDLPLHLANPWLPQHLTLLGSANADIDLTQRAGLWSGSIRWQQSNTVLQIAEIDDRLTKVSVPRAELQAELRDGGAIATAWLSVDPGINGQLDVELARFALDAPMRAQLSMRGEQWDWLSAIFPEVDAFKGSISADVTASGPLNAPEFAGNINWRDGGLLVPAMNVPLENIEVVISG